MFAAAGVESGASLKESDQCVLIVGAKEGIFNQGTRETRPFVLTKHPNKSQGARN